MPGKKKQNRFKKVAKDVATGVRVCCSNVVFEPSAEQKLAGMEQLLGKAEGVIVDFEPKSKKWIVKLDNNSMQLFTKRQMTVLEFVEQEVRSKTNKNVVLVKKKTPPSAVVGGGHAKNTLTLTQMERLCHESGTPTKAPIGANTRKAPPSTPPAIVMTKRPHLTLPTSEQSTPTPKTANTSGHSTPASKASQTTNNVASLPFTQDADVMDGDGPVEYNLEAVTPAKILHHLKSTGLDPSQYGEDNTESIETADSTY